MRAALATFGIAVGVAVIITLFWSWAIPQLQEIVDFISEVLGAK